MPSFAVRYEQRINAIISARPAPDKFAHTYRGLALWLGAGILLWHPLRSPILLAIVVAPEVTNESVDRIAHGGWMWHDRLGDAAATWFSPVVLTIAIRRVAILRR